MVMKIGPGCRRLLLATTVATMVALIAACGSSPTAPAAPTATATRIIAVSGSLAFGNVNVGSTADRTFTIGNSGTATLTFTSFSCSGGSGPTGYSSNITSGTVAPNSNVTVTVRFSPTVAQFYSCVLSIVGDQTSGGAAINVSGTGISTAVPTTYSLTGIVTDGTSHGFLPNITVLVINGANSGKSAVTDGIGNYSISSLVGGTFTVSASAVGYVTTTQDVTVPATLRADLVLQRTGSTPPPTPTAQCPNPPYTITTDADGTRHCREPNGRFALNACCGL